MGDPTKFKYISEYYAFNISLVILLVSELFIYFYTYQKSRGKKANNKDRGTKWLLYLNFIACIMLSFYCVSHAAPKVIRQAVFPSFVADIGIILILVGIVIRVKSVLTLKKFFTLNVQTAKEQRLITSGLYHKVRHPAYSGSIVSLLGVSLSLRSVLSTCLVLACCIVCYHVRIKVEEKALQEQFSEEYAAYKKKTYRLFPYIF